MILRYIIFIVAMTIVYPSLSQSSETTTKHKKVKILPVPTFSYEPETATQIGVVSLFTLDFYQDSLTRVSNAKVEFDYTFRNQMIAEAEWNYFFRQETWFFKGLIHISKYPDFYYGIGNNTKDTQEILFNSNRFILNINLFKNFGKKRFVGLGIRNWSYQAIKTDAPIFYQELKPTSVFGVKATFLQDSRNNLLNTTVGKYYSIAFNYNFSNTNYLRSELDVRKYFTSNQEHTVAIRLYSHFNFHTPNFYDYAILGGDEYVRGYFYGRYRDRNLSILQLEYRSPMIWRLGLAAIGGISTLYSDFSSVHKFFPNYGIGMRFLIDKKDNINLRLDYVWGIEQQSGVYISFGEAF